MLEKSIYQSFVFLIGLATVASFTCPMGFVQTLFADPSDCTQYYQCLPGGKFFQKSCPAGLRFDSRYRICNWASLVPCNMAEADVNQEPPADNEPYKFVELDNNRENFVGRKTGQRTDKAKDDNVVGQEGSGDIESDVYSNSEDAKYSNEETKVIDDIRPKVKCRNAFGFLTDPVRCDIFYHCYMWVPYPKICPAGLYFDALSLVCNWPRQVNCKYGWREPEFETIIIKPTTKSTRKFIESENHENGMSNKINKKIGGILSRPLKMDGKREKVDFVQSNLRSETDHDERAKPRVDFLDMIDKVANNEIESQMPTTENKFPKTTKNESGKRVHFSTAQATRKHKESDSIYTGSSEKKTPTLPFEPSKDSLQSRNTDAINQFFTRGAEMGHSQARLATPPSTFQSQKDFVNLDLKTEMNRETKNGRTLSLWSDFNNHKAKHLNEENSFIVAENKDGDEQSPIMSFIVKDVKIQQRIDEVKKAENEVDEFSGDNEGEVSVMLRKSVFLNESADVVDTNSKEEKQVNGSDVSWVVHLKETERNLSNNELKIDNPNSTDWDDSIKSNSFVGGGMDKQGVKSANIQSMKTESIQNQQIGRVEDGSTEQGQCKGKDECFKMVTTRKMEDFIESSPATKQDADENVSQKENNMTNSTPILPYSDQKILVDPQNKFSHLEESWKELPNQNKMFVADKNNAFLNYTNETRDGKNTSDKSIFNQRSSSKVADINLMSAVNDDALRNESGNNDEADHSIQNKGNKVMNEMGNKPEKYKYTKKLQPNNLTELDEVEASRNEHPEAIERSDALDEVSVMPMLLRTGSEMKDARNINKTPMLLLPIPGRDESRLHTSMNTLHKKRQLSVEKNKSKNDSLQSAMLLPSKQINTLELMETDVKMMTTKENDVVTPTGTKKHTQGVFNNMKNKLKSQAYINNKSSENVTARIVTSAKPRNSISTEVIDEVFANRDVHNIVSNMAVKNFSNNTAHKDEKEAIELSHPVIGQQAMETRTESQKTTVAIENSSYGVINVSESYFKTDSNAAINIQRENTENEQPDSSSSSIQKINDFDNIKQNRSDLEGEKDDKIIDEKYKITSIFQEASENQIILENSTPQAQARSKLGSMYTAVGESQETSVASANGISMVSEIAETPKMPSMQKKSTTNMKNVTSDKIVKSQVFFGDRNVNEVNKMTEGEVMERKPHSDRVPLSVLSPLMTEISPREAASADMSVAPSQQTWATGESEMEEDAKATYSETKTSDPVRKFQKTSVHPNSNASFHQIQKRDAINWSEEDGLVPHHRRGGRSVDSEKIADTDVVHTSSTATLLPVFYHVCFAYIFYNLLR